MSDIVLVGLFSATSTIVVGALSLVGIIVTSNKNNREMQHKIELSQEVTKTEIKELTREVREHNGFAVKIPLLEGEIERLKTRVKELEALHKREA